MSTVMNEYRPLEFAEKQHRFYGTHPGPEFEFVTNGEKRSYRKQYDKHVPAAYDPEGNIMSDYESYWNRKHGGS